MVFAVGFLWIKFEIFVLTLVASSIAAVVAFSPLPSIDVATLSALLDDLQPPNPKYDFLPIINYMSSLYPSLQQVAMFMGLVSVVQSPSCAFLVRKRIGALYH